MERVCSKINRSVLMGMAIIMIIICHITQFIGVHKGMCSWVSDEFLFASAAVGVDLFFFFSLVGLGFSLEKNSVIVYYKHRIKRIYPAYVLFLFFVLAFFYSEFSLFDKWTLFGQQVSGISATTFVDQRIEWYIPSLLLLYAVFPLAFRIVRCIHNNRILEVVTLGITILSSYMLRRYFVGLFSMRLPLYYLAILTFFYLKEEESHRLDSIFIIAAIACFFVKDEILSFALIIPLFLSFVNRKIDAFAVTKIGRAFAWIGRYTLEIYLAQVIATKYMIKLLPTNNVLAIVFAVFFATALLAFVLHLFQRCVLGIIDYLKSETRQKENNERLSWVDATKGFAMLIIVWGHVQHPSSLRLFLSSFPVPTFLVLTGFLLSRDHNKVRIGWKPLFTKLLRPFFSFSLIAIVCWFIYRTFSSGIMEGIKITVENVYKTITGYGVFAIWFISSYAIARYLFSKTYMVSLGWQLVLMLLWAGIGIVGSELFVWLKQKVVIPCCYDAIYYPIASIVRGIACTFFIVLGSLLYKIFAQFRDKNIKAIATVLIVPCIVGGAYLSRYLEGTNFSLLHLGARPYLYYVCSSLGSIWVIALFYLIKDIYSFPLLQWIGRKSLIIMGTHMSLVFTSIIPILLSYLIIVPADGSLGYYLFGLVCATVILIIEIPIIQAFDGPLKKYIFSVNKTRK